MLIGSYERCMAFPVEHDFDRPGIPTMAGLDGFPAMK